jgi:hypothetical protein
MRAHFTAPAAVAAAVLFLALPASAASPPKPCGEGKLQVRGECVVACSTTGSFTDASCECPPGFGKILLGGGGAECRRLACPTTKAFDPKLCDCPGGYEKKAKSASKATCVQAKAKAT